MRVILGLQLGGPNHRKHDVDATARVGEPIWGPAALLRNLELRLGLPPVTESTSARVPLYKARIASLADANAFYAKSFEADPIGAATALLAWRDGLVEAGWAGARIPNGGDRLDALAALETHGDEPLPLSRADQLARVERELRTTPARIYDSITLLDDRALFTTRWRRIFDRLETLGTSLQQHAFNAASAPATSDLAVVQAHLRGETHAATLKGDGSFLLFRGDTLGDLAELTAAFLAKDDRARGAVVVRPSEHPPLEAALARHGLAAQGHAGASAWRPAMQVLPLALELAFEPRDPYRVLELLTLPEGPFSGLLGRMLAKAVASQPGIGGQAWEREKKHAAELLQAQHAKAKRDEGVGDAEADDLAQAYVAERMARVADWLEAPGAPRDGISRDALLAVAARIERFLQKRMMTPGADALYRAAWGQASNFTQAVVNDGSDRFTQEHVRQILDRLARGLQAHDLSTEEAGRIPHVSHPSALLAAAETVVFWNFVSGAQRVPTLPWSAEERDALAAAGVVFVDPAALLEAEAASWRRAVLSATKRVVLVVPASVRGEAMSAHPLWDEIHARLGLDDLAASRITRHASAVLASGDDELVRVEPIPPLPLPDPRGVWQLPADILTAEDDLGTSATSLERLASCPLSWVLEQKAKLRPGAMAKVAEKQRLNGNLGHRLVEELHREQAFDLDETAFRARARELFDHLVRTEGATLLLAGAADERNQLARQMESAMRELHRYLKNSGYRIAAVEEQVETQCAIGDLHGRIDVRLVDPEQHSAVLDLKWGRSSYQARLAEGRAVQLAAYVRALAKTTKGGSFPPAAYYTISRGQVIATDARMKPTRPLEGPTLEQTWSRVEATTKAILAVHEQGRVLVSSTKRALPLLDALAIPKEDRDRYFETTQEAPCEHCAFGAICGRSWEAIS